MIRRIKQFTLSLLLIVLSTSVWSMVQDTYPFASSQDTERFQHLTQEIRCVVCQNQNIADSEAPLANDLRNKVYHMVLANQSDTAIKHYLVQRYGDFILLRPRMSPLTGALWILPFLLLSIALGFLIWRVKKSGIISTIPSTGAQDSPSWN